MKRKLVLIIIGIIALLSIGIGVGLVIGNTMKEPTETTEEKITEEKTTEEKTTEELTEVTTEKTETEIEVNGTEENRQNDKQESSENAESNVSKDTLTLDDATYQELLSLFATDASRPWDNWYLRGLTSYYSTPGEIDLGWLFQYGCNDSKPSEEEYRYYEENMPEDGPGIGALFRITESGANDVLNQYFGISLSQTKEGFSAFEGYTYYEITGNYLINHMDAGDYPVTFMGGTKLANGDVELYYTFYDQESVVTLRNQSGTWKMKSNQSVNGEEHPYAQWD